MHGARYAITIKRNLLCDWCSFLIRLPLAFRFVKQKFHIDIDPAELAKFLFIFQLSEILKMFLVHSRGVKFWKKNVRSKWLE